MEFIKELLQRCGGICLLTLLVLLSINHAGVSDEPHELVTFFLKWHATSHGSGHFGRTVSIDFEDMTGSAIVRLEKKRYGSRGYLSPYDTRILFLAVNSSAQGWEQDFSCAAGKLSIIDFGHRITNPTAYSGLYIPPPIWLRGTAPTLIENGVERQADGVSVMRNPLKNLGFLDFETYSFEDSANCPQVNSSGRGHPGGGAYPSLIASLRPGLDLVAVSPKDDSHFLLNAHFTNTTPALLGGPLMSEITWTAEAWRLGKCAGQKGPLEDTGPNDPIVTNEVVTITPDQDTITPDGKVKLHVKVTCDFVPVSDAKVKLTIEPQPSTGGHMHSASHPLGKLNDTVLDEQNKFIEVKTDSSGEKIVTFQPANKSKFPNCSAYRTYGIAGIYEVSAYPTRFPEHIAKVSINVKFSGLVPLPNDPSYDICAVSTLGCHPGEPGVGRRGTNEHPDGMWGTPNTIRAFQNLARDFWQTEERMKQQLQQCWPKPKDMLVRKLSINDIALPWGGKFDLGQHWGSLDTAACPSPPHTPHESHQTHGTGTGGDINHFKEPGIFEFDCQGHKEKWEDFWTVILLSTGLGYGHWDQYDQGQPNKELHLHVED